MEALKDVEGMHGGQNRRRENISFLFTFFFFLFFAHPAVHAQKNQQQPTQQLKSSSYADTWVATDALGRSLPTAEVTGPLQQDKFVGIFYFIWQGAHGFDTHRGQKENGGIMSKLPSDTVSPYNLMELVAENPEDPQYGPMHAFHYWGEPYFGYYLPDDEWIIRKHAQMLSDAGVDVIFFDVTNAALYLPQVKKIGEVYKKMRAEGNSTPSISFLLNTHHIKTGKKLYEKFYLKRLYEDLWFNWKGKPLLLCNPEGLPEEMRNFFTLRQSWAWSKGQEWFGDGKDKWTWLDHSPQSYGWHDSPDKPEQVSVSVAQHPVTNIGRSFHNGKQPKPENFETKRGLYFNEQWQRALEVDPEFIFITGWNEWVAMRFNNGSAKSFLGEPIEKGETFFVDLYNEEYNRDIEPMKGGYGDNYYYQMVANIRKFKGTRSLPPIYLKHTIKVDGIFDDWSSVNAVYMDDSGDVTHRKHPGWGRIDEYRNVSGRNDIIAARTAQDDQHLAFYVKADRPFIGQGNENWMNLFISIKDAADMPDWEGYHFMITWNKAKKKAILEKSLGGWKWNAVAEVSMAAGERELELSIPKSALSIDDEGFIIDFKWVDNMPLDGDIMHWLDKGDAAPNGRFRYRASFYSASDDDI